MKQQCGTCLWWGEKVNCIISATIKESVQVCCNPVCGDGVIVTSADDVCLKWANEEHTMQMAAELSAYRRGTKRWHRRQWRGMAVA